MKTKAIQITLVAAAFACVGSLQAQDTLDWFIVAGGGGTISGGAYTLDGTVGQPDAGDLSGGGYDLTGGFWAGAIFAPTLSITRTGAEAILAWTGSGFMLQSADEAAGPWVDFSAGVSADGVHYRMNAPISGRKRFFRLR